MDYLTSRICTKEDLPDIIDIIKINDTLYGVNLKQSGMRDLHINMLTIHLTDPQDNVKLIGVYNANTLVSFSLMKFWDSLPVWSAVFMYSRLDKFNLENNESAFIVGMTSMLKIAEAREIYNFYTVTRYSKIWKRWNLIFAENFPNYTVSEVEILEPFQESRWPIFQKMLSIINGKQEKSIVILNFLRSNVEEKNIKFLRPRPPRG
jgi:hypothetical protein